MAKAKRVAAANGAVADAPKAAETRRNMGAEAKSRASHAASTRRVQAVSTAPLRKSSKLADIRDEILARVTVLEEERDCHRQTIEVMLGKALSSRSESMVAAFSRKDREPINKAEFRKRVRKMISGKAAKEIDTREIDRIWDELDIDNNGTLETEELVIASERYAALAVADAEKESDLEARVAEEKEMAQLAEAAYEATLACERAQEAFTTFKSQRSVGVR